MVGVLACITQPKWWTLNLTTQTEIINHYITQDLETPLDKDKQNSDTKITDLLEDEKNQQPNKFLDKEIESQEIIKAPLVVRDDKDEEALA